MDRRTEIEKRTERATLEIFGKFTDLPSPAFIWKSSIPTNLYEHLGEKKPTHVCENAIYATKFEIRLFHEII